MVGGPSHNSGTLAPVSPDAQNAANGTGSAAHQIAHASAWGSTTISERLRWVKRFRALLASNADTLCRLVSEETGKPAWEALSGDLLPLLAACKWHERHASRVLAPSRAPGTPFWMLGQRHTVHRAPLGRVAIIATWNYPLQLLGIQMVQALVCGNAVVIKPSERSPRSQRELARLAIAAGLPPATLEVRDHDRSAGNAMLEQGTFEHILFTGSTRVGRQIAALAASTLTPTTLELSGNDSAFVLSDADPGLAARCIWNALVMNAGQTCLAPRRVLVDRSIYTRFLAALSPLAAGAKPVPVIDTAAAAHTVDLCQRSFALGARSLSSVLEAPDGHRLRPIAMVDCPPTAPLALQEHFGPALAVIPCDGVATMLALHAGIDQKLSTSVFTRSPASARGIADQLGSSFVTINDCVLPCSHPGASIAGHRTSGWGASRGSDGLRALSRAVTVSSTNASMRLPPEPPSPAAARFIARFMLWWYSTSAAPRTPDSESSRP